MIEYPAEDFNIMNAVSIAFPDSFTSAILFSLIPMYRLTNDLQAIEMLCIARAKFIKGKT